MKSRESSNGTLGEFQEVVERLAVVLAVVLALSGCGGGKPETDLSARLNSASARAHRISVYAGTALTELPLIAAELKWTDAKMDQARGFLTVIRDGSSRVAVVLGDIVDSAITGEQKIIIAPLLKAIVEGLGELEKAGLFALPSNAKLESYIHLAIVGLKMTINLLPVFPGAPPAAGLERTAGSISCIGSAVGTTSWQPAAFVAGRSCTRVCTAPAALRSPVAGRRSLLAV